MLWAAVLLWNLACGLAHNGDGSETTATYTEKYFKQRLDHFRFERNETFWQQRYLMNADHWDGSGKLPNGCKGPILFYTGNEGPIDAFWGSNGFMIDVLAPKWGALVIFGEHRFYGKSLPMGDRSFTKENVQYLTTEQALADYARLLTSLKADQEGAGNCPVIAFGGSYGGTLTTYFRMKYPSVVAGGLAASAPFRYYVDDLADNGLDEYTWIDIVNADYSNAPSPCLDSLTAALKGVVGTGATPAGRAQLQARFRLCKPLEDVEHLVFLITDALETMPQMNYPYPVGGLPAWPVSATCGLMAQHADAGLVEVVSMYYNASGSAQCIDAAQGQGGIPGGGPWSDAWGYQSCTETLHKFSARGLREFKFTQPWAASTCTRLWGVVPNLVWTQTHFSTMDVRTATNLIFSNGLLDPWHGGGVLSERLVGPSCHVLKMPLGAHHLDLRGPHPEDPANVTATRAMEEKILKQWIDEAAAV